MGVNVVEILVKASDETGPGFAKAKDSAVSSADEIAAAQDRVTQAENKLRDAQIQQTGAQLKLEELQQSGKASAEEIAAAQDKVTTATLRAADAQIRLGEADGRLALAEKAAGDAAIVQADKTEAGLVTRLGAGLKAAGAGMAGFGSLADLALAGVGYEAIKMSMNFQAAMERLVTQAGVPQKELAGLKTGVLNLAGAVGFSPESLAESLYHVASNMESMKGSSPAKMLDAVKIAAEGARVGGANLVDVTTALTSVLASGIPGAKNFAQAMGALNATVGVGEMNMQQLAEAFSTGVVPVVKGYGLTLRDVGAALATFGDLNVRGAEAGTKLRMAVQSFAVPAASGVKILKEMGMSAGQLARDMETGGLLKAVNDLNDHLHRAGVTAQTEGQYITDIFGKKAGAGAALILENLDRFRSKYQALTDGANSFGEAWKKTGETLSQQWASVRMQFEAMLVQLGDKLIPVLSAVLGFLEHHKAVIRELAPVVMAVVGAFAALKLAMAAVSAVSSLGPWGIALMAVVAATVLLIEHWKTVKKVVAEVFDWVKGHWVLLTPLLLTPLGPLIALGIAVYEVVKHFRAIEDVAKAVVRVVVAAFDAIKAAITGRFDAWWKSHGREIEEVWRVLWRYLRDVFTVEWAYITAALRVGWDVVTGIFRTGWDVITTIFKVAWDIIGGGVKIALAGIVATVKITWDILVGIFNVFLDLITGHWSKAWHDLQAMFEQVWNALKQFFRSALSDLLAALGSALRAMVSGVRNIATDMFDAGKNIILALWHGMESVVGGVLRFADNLGHDIANALGHPFGIHFSDPSEATQMVKAGQNIALALGKGMLSGRSSVAAAANHLAGSAGIGPGAGYGQAGGGGPMVLQIKLGAGSSGLEQLFWNWLKNGIRAQGGDPRLINRKVVFVS